jgi:dTDP-glucose pyrophosphorylase
MAGKNTRFHDLGYDIPKYLLPFPYVSVIRSIITNLDQDNIFNQIYLVAHERDIYFKLELLQILDQLEINSENLFYIGETKGQAETAFIATGMINQKKSAPIVFHNADTILLNRDMLLVKKLLENNIGFIDTFISNNKKYSYVDLNKDSIIKIAEKEVISEYATSGLYGFASCDQYQKYYLEFNSNLNSAENFSEIYISDVIKYMIFKDKIFKTNPISTNQKTIVLGSPKEYIEALKNLGDMKHEI